MAVIIPDGDFVTSTLNGAISNSATSMTIGTGLNIPATNGVLQIDYDSTTAVGADNGPETISYTAYNSGTGAVTGMTRGVDTNTSGVAHANGASVQLGASALLFTGQLGYAEITSDFTSATSGSAVDVTGLSVTVTVPAGGRRVKITAYAPDISTGAAASTVLEWLIYEGATLLNESAQFTSDTSSLMPAVAMAVVTPSAGSHTYKVAIKQNGAGTMTVDAGATFPAFILVELI